MNGKRVLVTGGTGFVGRHLLPLLLATGARVTCLARLSAQNTRAASLPDGVAVVRTALESGEGLEKALGGQDVVIHMAALLFGPGWQDYLRANAGAAQALAGAVKRLEAKGEGTPSRVVLVSSLAATGPCACSPGVTDKTPPRPVSAYGWSKLLVERILGEALGSRLVTLRPPIIYGSGDRGLLPVFRAAARGFGVSSGLFREFPVSVVHVRDACRAILCCCGEKANGVYHVNDGTERTMSEFNRAMGAPLGRKVRVLRLPLPVMAVTAGISTVCGRFLGRVPSWNLDKYREAKHAGWLCDASRLGDELGYAPSVSLEQGMAEAVDGYRREGLL
ncbi:MAG: NAD(P)-dependent oxidoreductase [Desulfovibrio sp.]|jgi:nucleoside-diphosphate-sugar epimerase|nr:NAD(P)-dependent oxidoreductase [Desulfovibrio sp.]